MRFISKYFFSRDNFSPPKVRIGERKIQFFLPSFCNQLTVVDPNELGHFNYIGSNIFLKSEGKKSNSVNKELVTIVNYA